HAGQQTCVLDAGRMNALGQHTDAFVNESTEDPGGEEAAAVVHHNGDLADLLHVVECAGQGVIGSFLAHDDFHQLHLVHRGEEVQADEVVRLGGGLGQLGNGDGGGVGGKDAVGHQFWFRFLGNPGFQVAVFKHGFDDQVATLQILGGGCGCDTGQYFVFLVLGHATAADFLGQQVLGVAFAFLRVLNRNILQHHFNTAAGRGVGNAGTHHAGTQDADFPE